MNETKSASCSTFRYLSPISTAFAIKIPAMVHGPGTSPSFCIGGTFSYSSFALLHGKIHKKADISSGNITRVGVLLLPSTLRRTDDAILHRLNDILHL